jgi:myo-inositol catabolism protein IolH
MQSAIDTTILRALSLEVALSEISKSGYKYIEIGLAHFSPADSSDEEAKILKELLERNGLQLASLLGIYPISYPEEEVRATGVQQFKRAIERAKTLDCNLIVSELNGDMDKVEDSRVAFEKSVTELLPDLERANVTLCFEAHPGDFIESNKLAVDLIRSVGSARIKYLYCAPHSFVLGAEISEMIESSRDVLGYVHVADTLKPQKTFFSGRYFPKVLPHQHLLPGLGDVDFKALFTALRKIHYNGFVTSNPFSHFDKPEEALKQSKLEIDSMLAHA